MSSLKLNISEDWAVVVLGFVIIFLAVWGLSIPAPYYTWKDSATLLSLFSQTNALHVLYQFVFAYCIVIIGAVITGKKIVPHLRSFPAVFGLTLIALLLSGNAKLNDLGLETVIFSLIIGLIVGNLFKLPTWIKESIDAEFLVKIGLVLLGTRVIFSNILEAGSLGL